MQKSETNIIGQLQKENEFLREENLKLKQKVSELIIENQDIIELADKAINIIHSDISSLDDDNSFDDIYSQMAEGYKFMGDINLKLANLGFTDELN